MVETKLTIRRIAVASLPVLNRLGPLPLQTVHHLLSHLLEIGESTVSRNGQCDEREGECISRTGQDMRRILIVEDYEDVREMLKILLESEHFHVLEAATGAEALTAVKDGSS